ncbi:MAG: rod shape-determining protein RodA [Bacteroidales bacterium]|nr:rod shape-determining protein RodA [Bacteroidales bacterium]
MRTIKPLHQIDWILVILYYSLVFFGWVNIYAADYTEAQEFSLNLSNSYAKQLFFIGVCTVLAFVIMLVEPKVFSAFSFVLYGVSIILLIAVVFIGTKISGARSWFHIGGFALQPSELAKFSTALALAAYLNRLNIDLTKTKTIITSAFIVLFPAALIMLQPDAGSALVFTSFVLVLFREGLTGNIFVIGITVGILFITTLVFGQIIILGVLAGIALLLILFLRKNKKAILQVLSVLILAGGLVYSVDYAFNNILEPHQRIRISILLGTESDPSGAGYNVNQSKIAIGSGGLNGKGFLEGTQTQFRFVPEQSTDFIFCTVGEEWGYLGTAFVILLFLAMIIRIVLLAEKQRSRFSRIYGYGVAGIVFFHFTVNIAMTIGLAPVIGIPLPFFSYGGSSLLGFTILLFIFIKQHAHRKELI